MKCLVTGGAGFIGSNIVLELQKDNDVAVIDNFLTGTPDNLKGYDGGILDIDISQPFDLDENFDVIIHEAAITDPRFNDDEEMVRSNIEGFKNIIKLAKKDKAKLVYASSASLYGNGLIPMKESQKKDILSAYGKSKLEMDKIAERHFKEMHIVGLRYFNVFGQREAHKGRPASMIYHLSNQIKSGKNPRIFKAGQQKRDHIYVKDVVNATIKALDAPSGIYNIGTGIGTTFNDLIKILNEVLKSNKQPEYFEMPYDPETYQANTQADTALAEKFLKWKSKYTLKEGIKDYMEWIDENEG